MFKKLINNVRGGFATNSSSSHSMVHYKKPVASDNTLYFETEFGWEDFRLDSLGGKLMYALVSRLTREPNWLDDTSPERVEELYKKYGHLFPEFVPNDFRAAMGGYVDHQSTADPDLLLEAARDPHIVIYGGNDNGGTTAWELAERFQGTGEVDYVQDSSNRKYDPDNIRNRW